MVVDVTGQILALGSLAVIGLLLNRLIKIELTLACLLTGFLAGLGLNVVDFDTGIRAHNLQEIVFFLILPVLIFEAAWHLKPMILRRWLPPILLLATIGVLISCFVTAGIIYFGIGHPTGFPWIAALLTGAILAATDPIAVISQLKSLNAPEDLMTLFEGESLFNDASAVVVFIIVLSFATQHSGGHGAATSGEVGYFMFFATVFLGGLGADTRACDIQLRQRPVSTGVRVSPSHERQGECRNLTAALVDLQPVQVVAEHRIDGVRCR